MCNGDGLGLTCYLVPGKGYAFELGVSIPTFEVGKHLTKNARIRESMLIEDRSLGLAQNRTIENAGSVS